MGLIGLSFFVMMTLFHLWDLPGDVLAAPESASGLDRCNLSLSLPLFVSCLNHCLLVLARLDTLTWSLFMSLLTHRLVFLCVDAYCFIFWDVPGDVLAAPESALCGWIGVILLSLSLSRGICQGMSWQHLNQPCVAG